MAKKPRKLSAWKQKRLARKPGDDHIKLIKTMLLKSFPRIADA